MDRKLNISKKALAILASCLVVLILVLALANGPEPRQEGEISICINGTQVDTYDIDRLSKLETTFAFVDLKSAKGQDDRGTYQGVALGKIQEESQIPPCQTVVFTAGDGYASGVKFEEANEVLIAYGKDGKLLDHFENGGTGPFRCVFINDQYGNRSVKFLVKIDFIR